MTDFLAFQSKQHHQLTQHLEADEANIVGVLLRGGHTEFFSSLGPWEAIWLSGKDADGTPAFVCTHEIVGFYLLDRAGVPQAESESGAGDATAPLEDAWLEALMELRAAAEGSSDEAVKAAASKLAGIEDQSP